jgi:hypothetical protein
VPFKFNLRHYTEGRSRDWGGRRSRTAIRTRGYGGRGSRTDPDCTSGLRRRTWRRMRMRRRRRRRLREWSFKQRWHLLRHPPQTQPPLDAPATSTTASGATAPCAAGAPSCSRRVGTATTASGRVGASTATACTPGWGVYLGLYKLNPLDPWLDSTWFQHLSVKCDFLVSSLCFRMQHVPLHLGGERSHVQRHVATGREARWGLYKLNAVDPYSLKAPDFNP